MVHPTNDKASSCKTILVVEDDEAIRTLLSEALGMEGYKVLQANNGEEGLRVLEQVEVHPCLVLLDLMMPVVNGWEFLSEIKKDNADIISVMPIYVVSAAGENADQAERQASGFLKKPVDLDLLFSIVERHCK